VTPQQIDRIYFMVHPLIYESHAHEPEFAAKYQCYIDYEKKIKARWYEKMADMAPNEALVVFMGPQQLEDDVNSMLGRRGLVVRDVIVQQPELWDELLGPEAKMGLGRDLLATYWRNGFKWTSDVIDLQGVISRGWAERIKKTYAERNLIFAPETVQTEGWGESFEGCVANYVRHLGTYLGLAKPIEVNFEMTVPDARFLLTAEFLERIPLEHSVRLYLWKAADGRLIGYFHKGLAAIADPPLYAEFSRGDMEIELRSKQDELQWPTPDSDTQSTSGQLKCPVPSGYVFARGATLDEFRDALTSARFVAGD